MIETAHTLVAVCGLPGVGKSTVSSYMTERLDAVRLRTDAIRKELVDEPTYSDAERNRVYDELVDQANQHLTDGASVVLDATFTKVAHREQVKSVADDNDVSFQLIRVVCDEETVARRIESREDISDADLSVYRELKAEFDPITIGFDQVDNSETISQTHDQVDSLLSWSSPRP
ncbi:AAA family ATPase [Halovenus rubra]|uniref:AAA family ATPase n=2 Tax=Halovenus rubra TaxID=869890 RepID=A0ABD5X5J5_9EURY|nr:AAA family ATPase [Halovenus rubra]